MDCVASLAMTAGDMERFAEPIIGWPFTPARWRAMTEAALFPS
jgi:hypothetical protein